MNEFHLNNHPEQIDASAFIAASADIIGDVSVGAESTIWYSVVIRGDVEPIRVGSQTSIQDGCVLHSDPKIPCTVGNRVTVGHGAIVHGATVEDDCLIGMRAVILNGARIGTGSVVAAGAIVTENTIIPPGSLVMGMPAKVRGPVSAEHRAMIERGTRRYVEAGKQYKARLDNRN